jgi:BASS family bile acid:Na+ symporter
VSEDAIIGVVMGAALIFIMFSMGLVLTATDFARVVRAPRVVFLGTVAQVVVLPLVAVITVVMSNPPSAVAVGLVLVAICPGGPVSNFFSHVSRGDAALSVTLTLVSTLLSLATLPVIFAWTPMRDAVQGIDTPTGFILQSLVVGVAMPTAAGMMVRLRWPKIAARAARLLEKVGLLLIFVVLSLLMFKNRTFYADTSTALIASVMLVNVGGMVAGYALAAAASMPRATRVTYAFEVGLQNIPLASVLAHGLFSRAGDGTSAVVMAVVGLYAVVSIASALSSVFLFKRMLPIASHQARTAVNTTEG